MATIGQSLTSPESGWIRYDDKDSRISYSPSVLTATDSSAYASTVSYINTLNAYIEFKMRGTKLRIISISNVSSYRCNSVDVYVDNVKVGSYTDMTSGVIYQRLSYEITNMTNDLHTIKLVGIGMSTNKVLVLDAIDIGSDGALLALDFVAQYYLVKQYNNFYSIKSNYYDGTNFIPIALQGTNPTAAEIKTYGIVDPNIIKDNMTVGAETFKPINKLYANFNIVKFKMK